MAKKKDERRTLLFGKGLLEPTLDGSKRCTIRKYRAEAHEFKKGEKFIGEFADGGRKLDLVCTDATVRVAVKRLTDAQAQADGFESAEHCIEGLSEYYPDLTEDTILGFIRFKMA